MNCAGCDAVLEPWQVPQPMLLGKEKIWPKAYCDTCAKGYPRHPDRSPPREAGDDGTDAA